MDDIPAVPASPRLAVVVVTYNSGAVIQQCLDALAEGLSDVENATVLLVDNASDDDTADIVGSHPLAVTWLQTGSNIGYAAACNRGIAAAGPTTDAVLLLNADVTTVPGSIRRLLDTSIQRPDVGIVVPLLREIDGSVAPSLRRDPSLSRAIGEALLGGPRAGRLSPALSEVVADPTMYERPGRVDWATGAAMLLSRSCLDIVGPLDETFFLYSEETDLALRTRDAGLAVWFEPSAPMTHRGGAAHTDAGLWSLLTVNRLRLYRRRHGRLAGGAYWGALVVNEFLRSPRSANHRRAFGALLSRKGLDGQFLIPSRPVVAVDAAQGVSA